VVTLASDSFVRPIRSVCVVARAGDLFPSFGASICGMHELSQVGSDFWFNGWLGFGLLVMPNTFVSATRLI